MIGKQGERYQFLCDSKTVFLSVYISFGNGTSVTTKEFESFTLNQGNPAFELSASYNARRVVNLRLLHRFYDKDFASLQNDPLVQKFLDKIDSSDLLHALSNKASKVYLQQFTSSASDSSGSRVINNNGGGSSDGIDRKFVVVVCMDEFQGLIDVSKQRIPNEEKYAKTQAEKDLAYEKYAQRIRAVFKSAANGLGLQPLVPNSHLPQVIAVYCCGTGSQPAKEIANEKSNSFRDYVRIPLTPLTYAETEQLLRQELKNDVARGFLNEDAVLDSIYAFTGGVPRLLEFTIVSLEDADFRGLVQIERLIPDPILQKEPRKRKVHEILRGCLLYVLGEYIKRYKNLKPTFKNFNIGKQLIAHGLLCSKVEGTTITSITPTGEKKLSADYFIDDGIFNRESGSTSNHISRSANNSNFSNSNSDVVSSDTSEISLPFVGFRSIIEANERVFSTLLTKFNASFDESLTWQSWEALCAQMVGIRAYCFRVIGYTHITLGELFSTSYCGNEFKSQLVSLGPEWETGKNLIYFNF